MCGYASSHNFDQGGGGGLTARDVQRSRSLSLQDRSLKERSGGGGREGERYDNERVSSW